MTIEFSDLIPEIITDDKAFRLKYDFKRDGDNRFCLRGQNDLLTDKLEFTVDGDGVICKRTVKNISGRSVKLKELSVGYIFSLGERQNFDYYYTTENLRLFHNFTIPVDFDRQNLRSLNGARTVTADTKFVDNGALTNRINSCPYMPFPAILIGNYKNNYGVVHGSLSQKYFYHNYEFSHERGNIRFEIFSSFKSVSYREFKPNEELTDEWYLGTTENADDFNRIFDGYTKKLKKVLSRNRGRLATNRHTLIWDSWNDGIYRDVSEKKLLTEARSAKKYFHNLEWFQLDDGYSKMCNPDVDLDAHGLGVVYEGESGIDRDKFPNGLKSYTDKVKKMGLKPAVWVGGLCPVCSKIYKERKDWFIDLKYRTETSQPLDVSNKDARKYMRGAISKFVKDYGFMGIKHDFWSYAFEESHDNYSDKSKAGYEYRRWWQKIFVDLLGKDGYVGTACDLSLGDPFIGRYFNNYRFGLDICAGKWSNLLVTMFWGVGCLGTHTGDLFIPNCDSIGMLPNLNDTDFLFWINHAIITRTIVEISGLYSQVGKNDKRLKILQKATACLNNGESVYFAGFDYRAKNDLPSIYYINSLYFARNYRYKTNAKTFAVFNPFDSEKEIAVDFKDISLKYDKATITDVWNGESKIVEKGFNIVLSPHESRLFTACESVKPNICDGNCEILNLKRNAKSLDFSVDYPVDAELTVNFKVKSVVVNGNAKEFYQTGGKLRFKIKRKSDISLLIK